LLGISLTNVTDEDDVQMSLFSDGRKDKARAVDRAVDEIRSKYGVITISRGAYGVSDNIGRKHKAQLDNKK
jgi:hypothetical protein